MYPPYRCTFTRAAAQGVYKAAFTKLAEAWKYIPDRLNASAHLLCLEPVYCCCGDGSRRKQRHTAHSRQNKLFGFLPSYKCVSNVTASYHASARISFSGVFTISIPPQLHFVPVEKQQPLCLNQTKVMTFVAYHALLPYLPFSTSSKRM